MNWKITTNSLLFYSWTFLYLPAINSTQILSIYSEPVLTEPSLDQFVCLEKTGVCLIQVKFTKISYIGTLFKFSLYTIPVYSGFSLDRLYCSQPCPAEGGTIFWGVFRVKNHDFMPKNHVFSNFRGSGVHARCTPPGSASDLY
jgi:hypothetical protein